MVPDGHALATACTDHTVRLWNPRRGGEGRIIGIHRSRCNCVAWLPDSRRVVSAAEDRTIRVWAAEGDTQALLSVGTRPDLPLTDTRGAPYSPAPRDHAGSSPQDPSSVTIHRVLRPLLAELSPNSPGIVRDR
ncbi:WD40 repeat domain-containing protein [Streptomyces sp. TLI_185]|uniref:WD40 repeat domain-containing protein n=1 Tax=Streptomyces sp. TLI_185 TaxID=2485151 RepID=UPI0037D9F106